MLGGKLTIITFEGFKLNIPQVLIRKMGAACQSCMRMFSKADEGVSAAKKGTQEALHTDRMLIKPASNKEDKGESVCGGKGSNIEIQSNSSVRETKIFMKNKSTALFSNDSDRRHSSVLQLTLDYESIIIRASSDGQTEPRSPDNYYTLIDKLAFIRKTMDCIRITSPDGQSELHCPPHNTFTTLSISEGRPVEIIEEVAANKMVQVNASPIKVKLKLKCKHCKKLMKLTLCKGLMNLSGLECPGCESKDKWSIADIEANAPVWGDGVKIDNHEEVEDAPASLRIMGCVFCLKFKDCERMKCGCLLCKNCLAANQDFSLNLQCRMCEGSYIL